MSTTTKALRSRDRYGRYLSSEKVEEARLMKYYKDRLKKPMVQVKPVQWSTNEAVEGFRNTLSELNVPAEDKRLIDYQTYLYNHAYE